jgi:dolichol-phosphate mannosyltransferase
MPVYNEQAGIVFFYKELLENLKKINYNFEIIFIDDGSNDETVTKLKNNLIKLPKIKTKIVALSRNFGKENALMAGVAQAKGDLTIMLDSDGQHPITKIADFIDKWQNTQANIIIGLRTANKTNSPFRKLGSYIYNKLINQTNNISRTGNVSQTDFLLMDNFAKQAFLQYKEHNRNNRQIISNLGFNKAFVEFSALPRKHGQASYSSIKLILLFFNSLVTKTVKPLYLSLFLGSIISGLSFLLGCFILIEQFILSDPIQMKFSGVACLSILLLFLVGVIITFIGIISIYLSTILKNSLNRPLFLIDEKNSLL